MKQDEINLDNLIEENEKLISEIEATQTLVNNAINNWNAKLKENGNFIRFTYEL